MLETATTMLGNRNQATMAVPSPPSTWKMRSSHAQPVSDAQLTSASTPTNSATSVASERAMPSQSTPRTRLSLSMAKARTSSCSIAGPFRVDPALPGWLRGGWAPL